MNCIIISEGNDNELIETCINKVQQLMEEEKYKYIHYNVRKEELHHCIGCFSCWIDYFHLFILFFEKVNNEVHHLARYNSYPQFVVIGCQEGISDDEAQTFKSLADANAINFKVDQAQTYICKDSEDINNSVLSLQRYFKLGGGLR